MSTITSLNKSYTYTSSPHRTPKLKEIIPASSSYADRIHKDGSPHPPIIDEYGQTPDHYYTAKKAPPTFYQVKRKLDLQIFNGGKPIAPQNQRLRRNGYSVKTTKKPRDKPRYDTSLGLLTKKFHRLLTDATDGIINLNTACALLAVPKRRLYDITNVLEGAGLVQKKLRNNVQWIDRASSPDSSVSKYDLEREIDILEAKENKLDELIYHMQREINMFKDKNEEYQYITSADLKSMEEFADKQLIGVSASPGHIIEASENSLRVSNENSEIYAKLLCDVSYKDINASSHEYSEIPKNDFINIKDSSLIDVVPKVLNTHEKSPEKEDSSISDNITVKVKTEESPSSSDIVVGSVWKECLEGDPIIRNAFISDEDDIGPIGKHFLLQTEDQNFDEFMPFSFLDNLEESYSFSLDNGEGLTDLYDCSGFQEIPEEF